MTGPMCARPCLPPIATGHTHKRYGGPTGQNGHKGRVVLTGAVADNRGCHQFRVTRMAGNAGGDADFAHVDVCRDGSML